MNINAFYFTNVICIYQSWTETQQSVMSLRLNTILNVYLNFSELILPLLLKFHGQSNKWNNMKKKNREETEKERQR